MKDQSTEFRRELESLINRHSAENVSNTPDHTLAQFLIAVLAAFDVAVVDRDAWYGVDLKPGVMTAWSSPKSGDES